MRPHAERSYTHAHTSGLNCVQCDFQLKPFRLGTTRHSLGAGDGGGPSEGALIAHICAHTFLQLYKYISEIYGRAGERTAISAVMHSGARRPSMSGI